MVLSGRSVVDGIVWAVGRRGIVSGRSVVDGIVSGRSVGVVLCLGGRS